MKRWGFVSVLLAACGQSPAPPASAPPAPLTSASGGGPDATGRGALETDAGPPTLDGAFESLTIGDSLPATDAVFQFHVETLTRHLPETAVLHGNFFSIRPDSFRLAGHWPDDAWALVFFPNWKLPDRGTARLYRWIKSRWQEVPAGRENDATDFSIDAWTQGRVVILRRALNSGREPRLMAISRIGTLVTPAPAVPLNFIGSGVESAPTGELFAKGVREYSKGAPTPAIAIWEASLAKVTVHDLPSLRSKSTDFPAGASAVNQVCVFSATSALALGEGKGDSHPVMVAWRWDGTTWSLETPAGTAQVWGSGCTPDRAVWIGSGDTLVRHAPAGDKTTYRVPDGLGLVTTNGGDVFVRRSNGWYQLRK